MALGYLSMVLHAHLPYVRHPGQEEILEERWLFEAITNCYIPLLTAMEKLTFENIPFRLTLSLSPPLLAMLKDSLLQEKYVAYLQRMIALGEKEVLRNQGQEDFLPLAQMYWQKAKDGLAYWEQCHGDLTARFKQLMVAQRLELITTCATHGYLPLMKLDESRRAQVSVGIQSFFDVFGCYPPGFWLPECGYVEGVDQLLQEQGINYFFVDTHGILGASPTPQYGIYAPLLCSSGVAAFGRDQESSRQVWERRVGYPGHPDYREFYRDIGFDLDKEALGPFLPQGIPVDTGYKYYRITGEGEKEPYRPEIAKQRVAEHAAHFLQSRVEQFAKTAAWMGDTIPMVVAPYDAELFGHWWYEGPAWLDMLCRFAASSKELEMITPGDYLQRHPQNQEAQLPMSSWGEEGYSYVWLNPENDWIYHHQHRSEAKMTELASLYTNPSLWEKRALQQAGRELLLAQSSDWAFILKEKTTTQYATAKVKEYLANFNGLVEQIEHKTIDPQFVEQLEKNEPVFPTLSYTIFGHDQMHAEQLGGKTKRVLLLSWEFPPRTIGGLARHVYDLSGALASLGLEVHVLTCPAQGAPDYQVERGVHVHRVAQSRLSAPVFLDWLEQLNQGMVDIAKELGQTGQQFDLVHAHDWLVNRAARTIAQEMQIPIVVTIHATEYGRNRGLFSDLQRSIHAIEKNLVSQAKRVICCSQYMAWEMEKLFCAGKEKVRVIPNGVNQSSLQVEESRIIRCNPHGHSNIVFLGRLVPEKGVQVLIDAMPYVLEKVGDACLLVAGQGPYEGELREKVEYWGLHGKIKFLGFLDDMGRNGLLAGADLAVFPSLYEPFGIVALEAMAAGVPVVVSDTGGLGEIIEHGVDGYKAPPGNVKMLATYICGLLLHPDLAQNFADQGRKKMLTRYNWQYIEYETSIVNGEVLEMDSLVKKQI